MNAMFSDWESFFHHETDQCYFTDLQQRIDIERQQHLVFPDVNDVYRAFTLTSYESTRVLLLGQDPYHGENQAHGLSFSVRQGVPLPPSLRNIMKERHDDIGLALPRSGDLTTWAQQGVLLLNSTLTVRNGEPASHHGLGWETFTDRVIERLNEKSTRVVFVLWGKTAQAKTRLISSGHHVVITAPHPSPLSAHRGFFGSRPFSTINAALQESQLPTIDWSNE